MGDPFLNYFALFLLVFVVAAHANELEDLRRRVAELENSERAGVR
jgi:hypothetical protein